MAQVQKAVGEKETDGYDQCIIPSKPTLDHIDVCSLKPDKAFYSTFDAENKNRPEIETLCSVATFITAVQLRWGFIAPLIRNTRDVKGVEGI